MALLLKDGSLYLHVPKTGGNWLTDMLEKLDLIAGEIGHKHATYGYISGLIRQERQSLRYRLRKSAGLAPSAVPRMPPILCVVRHPLRWYESWFRYQTGRDWRAWGMRGDLHRWHPCSELNGLDHSSFEAFIAGVHAQAPGFASRLMARYAGESGAHVLKAETLREDFAAYLTQRGLRFDPEMVRAAPRVGESPKVDLSWDADLLRRTEALESAGFALFGYGPDSAT